MSGRRPAVLFADSHTWETFSALAGALRMHDIGVLHVTARPQDMRTRALQQLDVPLYGRPRRLVLPGTSAGAPATIAARDLADLVAPSVIDVQAHDDLLEAVAAAPTPLTDFSRRVGNRIDPAVLFDKWALAETVSGFGIPTPAVWNRPVTESFPVVVKARTGFAGTGVRIAHDASELAAAWEELGSVTGGRAFVQAFHGAGLVKSGGVARGGDLIVSAAYRSDPARSDPTGPPLRAAVTSNPQIEALTLSLVERLGYTGFFNTDWVIDDSGTPHLIDLNARAFGSWPALQACGVDFIGAYLHSLDLGPRPVPGPVRHEQFRSLLRFPFPPFSTRAALLRYRRRSLDMIEDRRAWLGGRWAAVSHAKVELATAQRWNSLRKQP